MVDDQELARKLSWLMAIRVLIIASVLLPTVVYSPNDDNGLISIFQSIFNSTTESPVTTPVISSLRARILQVLVGTVSLQTLVYVGLLRVLRHRQTLHAYIQIFGDILLISLLLYKFGRSTANISVLYFLIIGVAAFLVRREASLVAAACASLLYGGVMVSHQSEAYRAIWYGAEVPNSSVELGWKRRFFEMLRPAGQDDISGVPLAYNLSVHFAGFLTVALFSKRLARDTGLEERLEKSSRDLQRLQVLHRDVIQSISSGLIATDLTGRITSVNRAAEEILDIRESLLLAGDIRDSRIFSDETWRESCRKVLNDGPIRSEVEMMHGGKPKTLGYTVTTLRDGTGAHRGYLVIFQDLTDWRSLEEKVRRQERMAAIGQMAAGLAHEVGNPLAAIAGSVQMLAGRPGKEMAERKLLDITLRESRRLDRIVKSFLQFAKPRERDLRKFDVALLLAEDCALLQHSSEINDSHQIELDVDPPTVEIEADRDQIAQIFWNLVRNALQAMPQGGKLSISGRLQGEHFVLRVEDNGRGMSEQERDKLFQPFKSFFDSGIGLGMAIVYRIVEEHSGEIQVESQLDQGTVITVILPVRPPAATASHLRPAELSKLASSEGARV